MVRSSAVRPFCGARGASDFGAGGLSHGSGLMNEWRKLSTERNLVHYKCGHAWDSMFGSFWHEAVADEWTGWMDGWALPLRSYLREHLYCSAVRMLHVLMHALIKSIYWFDSRSELPAIRIRLRVSICFAQPFSLVRMPLQRLLGSRQTVAQTEKRVGCEAYQLWRREHPWPSDAIHVQLSSNSILATHDCPISWLL